MGTSIARRYDPVMSRYLNRLAERGIPMQKIETAQRHTESLSLGAALLWAALDRDRATMAHQCSFDGGVMLVREFWSEFSRTVFRIRR